MRTAIKYGVFCGLLTCFWVMSEFLLGLHNEHFDLGLNTRYFITIIPLVTIFKSMREQKKLNEEHSSFGKLLLNGLILVLIAAVITGTFMWTYINFINPDWQNIIISREAERMMMEGVSPSELLAAADRYKTFTNPMFQFGVAFITVFSLGMVISLIYSFLLRKRA